MRLLHICKARAGTRSRADMKAAGRPQEVFQCYIRVDWESLEVKQRIADFKSHQFRKVQKSRKSDYKYRLREYNCYTTLLRATDCPNAELTPKAERHRMGDGSPPDQRS